MQAATRIAAAADSGTYRQPFVPPRIGAQQIEDTAKAHDFLEGCAFADSSWQEIVQARHESNPRRGTAEAEVEREVWSVRVDRIVGVGKSDEEAQPVVGFDLKAADNEPAPAILIFEERGPFDHERSFSGAHHGVSRSVKSDSRGAIELEHDARRISAARKHEIEPNFPLVTVEDDVHSRINAAIGYGGVRPSRGIANRGAATQRNNACGRIRICKPHPQYTRISVHDNHFAAGHWCRRADHLPAARRARRAGPPDPALSRRAPGPRSPGCRVADV